MATITDGKTIGTLHTEKGAVKAYRSAPGHFHSACLAGLHYAKKCNEAMALIPGNSYGNKVFNIVPLAQIAKGNYRNTCLMNLPGSVVKFATVATDGTIKEAFINM